MDWITTWKIALRSVLAAVFILVAGPVSGQQQAAAPTGPLQLQGMPALLGSVQRIEAGLQRLADPRWEYLFLQRNRLQSIDRRLNELGQQGWELVAVTVEEGFILKRQRR